MGVPKFYRWISERYPCLSEVVKEFQLPEFDNLYLDMNGVVHVCSHPEDDNPHFRITEEQIFKDICHYIEFLFRMIKPRKVFFMAIDGVAPRAKMNQQRGRRFRSAREAEELIKQAQDRGEELPTEKRFDSNCITPGTPFMVRLQDHLKYFVVNKVTHDPLWQGPKIILSGHETPGEGEHKVMDFIRYSRSQSGHDPNTRHCLYGLDADLIMLGLTSHEPHFALLREEVRFGGGRKGNQKRPATPEETTFHLLHLSLMREYLDYEFSDLKDNLPFGYDMEKVIDDWILMGFLVGNDFIPHLPHLHIHHDALPLLWKTYIEVLPSLDGYLNEGGHLNLRRFEKYIGALAQFDRDKFSEQYLDMKYLESKQGGGKGFRPSGFPRNGPSQQKKKTRGDGVFAVLEGLDDMDLEYNDSEENGKLEAHLVSQGIDVGHIDSDEDFDTFDAEFNAHKRDYYMTKLEYENVTPEVLREQAQGYVRAIQWILLYYYEGVQSWSWYYPHHYAPFISDVRNFSDMVMQFDMSEPFRPFEQLMAVLPAASKELLPEPLQDLMTNDSSPVLDYYPVNFKTDLNGKQQDWEAVVLIPFIDERRLLAAMRTKEHLLTPEERRRNAHGPCYMYQHSTEVQGFYQSPMPGVFPDVAANHAKICDVPKFHFCLSPERIVKGLMNGVLLDVYFPGFPTLKHIPHEHRLDKCGVKVFQMNSRGFNTMLKINDLPERRLEDIAADVLGQTTWVGWPHLHEAKVFAVADERFKIEIEEQPKKGQSTPMVQWKKRELNRTDLERVFKEAADIKEKYYGRFGVEVGKTTVLLYAGPMTGQKYVYTSGGRITTEKQFSIHLTPYALQATCKDILTHTENDMHLRTMDELFPAGAPVFMLGNPHYGCQGEVLEVDSQEGRVRVSFSVLQEPDFTMVCQNHQTAEQNYMPGYVAAQRIGLNNHMLSRITGTVLILRGDGNTEAKANIGLNLKFTKRGEEVPGYTRKTDDGWRYSDKCLQTVSDYLNQFGELWDYIASSHTGNSDIYTEVELFPEESEKKLKDVLEFLQELPCAKVQCMKTGANIVEDTTVHTIVTAVDNVAELNRKKQKRVKMQVKPHLLFRPLPNQGTLEPDPGSSFEMLDRVVVVKMGYSVPFGLRGTIVGIHPGETAMDTVYDVIFDQDFVGGISLRGSIKRGYRVPAVALLNLSHGETRKHPGRQGPAGQQGQQTINTPPWNAWQQQQQQQLRQGFGYQGSPQAGTGQGSYSMLRQREGSRTGSGSGMAPPQMSGHTGYNFPSQMPPKPQFVTPKFATSPPKAARVQPASKPSFPASDNGDFTNMWNQLLQSNASAGGPTHNKPSQPFTAAIQTGSTTGASANKTIQSSSVVYGSGSKSTSASRTKDSESFSSPIFGGTSLQFAAEKLGKLTIPEPDLMEIGESDNPPTGILVDLSDPEQIGDSAVPPHSGEPASQGVKHETKKAKTRVFTNSNHNRSQSEDKLSQSQGNNPSVMALFEKASKEKEERMRSPSQSAETESRQQTDKVQALFDQVQKPASISEDAGTVPSEFSAFFAALQAAPMSASPSNQPVSPLPSTEDGSAALKQMLKIGVEDSAGPEVVNKKSYGKQLSVQELFDVAKQAPSSSQPDTLTESQSVVPSSAAPPVKGQPEPQQQQSQQQPSHHQQQFVLPGHPPHPSQAAASALLPPPSLLGNSGAQARTVGRKPVDELAAFCQSMGKPLPKYDFNYQSKQKGFISLVTLPGGARFEGSLSASQQDAAESAASMALLCLKQAQMGFPGQRGVPWMQRGGPGMGVLRPGPPLFSSNSAFSPVANPLMRFGPPAMFSQPPPGIVLASGQRGRQPLLSQPLPPFSNRGSHPLPASQVPPMMNAAYSQAPQWTGSQSQPCQPGDSYSASVSHPHHPPPSQPKEQCDQAAEEKIKEVTVKSSTEAFIPLQVTRKQRRKEDTPEKPTFASMKESTDDHQHQTPVSAAPNKTQTAHSPSPGALKQDCVNNNPGSSVSGTMNSVGGSQNAKGHKSSSARNSSSDNATHSGKPAAREDMAAEGGKKRRPRIAANFKMGPPK